MWKWPNFSPVEVLSLDGLKMFDKGILLIQPILLDALEEFRVLVGYPLLINNNGHTHRGYRSCLENKLVDGKDFSYHIQGLASDISCVNISLVELHEKALAFRFTGIGFYPTRNFIHCDIRPKLDGRKDLWNG